MVDLQRDPKLNFVVKKHILTSHKKSSSFVPEFVSMEKKKRMEEL